MMFLNLRASRNCIIGVFTDELIKSEIFKGAIGTIDNYWNEVICIFHEGEKCLRERKLGIFAANATEMPILYAFMRNFDQAIFYFNRFYLNIIS